jgi:Redoxin
MADRVRLSRARRVRTLVACLGTVIVVAAVAAAVIVLRGNGFPANGESGAAKGTAFPDVTLADADGVTISTSSLRGKPTLVWFAVSSCPDVEGLHRVARLDEETGGHALQIVMVFLDQRAPSSMLAAWRNAFARPDGLIAPDRDGAVSTAAGVRMPETKMLLDEHTTIVDQTSSLVDDTYLSRLRQQAHA